MPYLWLGFHHRWAVPSRSGMQRSDRTWESPDPGERQGYLTNTKATHTYSWHFLGIASGLYHIMNRAAILTPAARNSPEKTILYFHKSPCPSITSCMKLLGPLSYCQLHWSHEGKHLTFHKLYWHYKSWGQTFNISWTLLTLSYCQLHWSHEGKHLTFHELYWHYKSWGETFNISWTLLTLSYCQLHWSHEGKHLTFHELYWHYKSWGETFNISWTLLTLSYRQLHQSHEGKHWTFHELYRHYPVASCIVVMRGNIQHFMNFTDIILSPAALKSWGETLNISWTLLTLSYHQLQDTQDSTLWVKPAAWTNPLCTQKIMNPFSKFISLKALPSKKIKIKLKIKKEVEKSWLSDPLTKGVLGGDPVALQWLAHAVQVLGLDPELVGLALLQPLHRVAGVRDQARHLLPRVGPFLLLLYHVAWNKMGHMACDGDCVLPFTPPHPCVGPFLLLLYHVAWNKMGHMACDGDCV